jgi:hypothetical protein
MTPTTQQSGTPAARRPRKKAEDFPAVTEEVPYGTNPNKRPVLYWVLAPLVMEAADHDDQTRWRSAKAHSISQIRSAAAAWGYRVNASKSVSGEPVFRLNGKLRPTDGGPE